jgi:hypothetical protein
VWGSGEIGKEEGRYCMIWGEGGVERSRGFVKKGSRQSE